MPNICGIRSTAPSARWRSVELRAGASGVGGAARPRRTIWSTRRGARSTFPRTCLRSVATVIGHCMGDDDMEMRMSAIVQAINDFSALQTPPAGDVNSRYVVCAAEDAIAWSYIGQG